MRKQMHYDEQLNQMS